MFMYFCDALKYIQELEELWMGGNNIGDEGLIYFTPKMKYIPLIKMIDITRNNISNTSFDIFITYFGKCLKLQDIYVMSIKYY